MITEEDIAKRLYRRCPFWFEGPPKVNVLPPQDEGSFGTLRFSFPDPEVGDIDFSFLYKFPEDVFAKANDAVTNFKEIIQAWFKERN